METGETVEPVDDWRDCIDSGDWRDCAKRQCGDWRDSTASMVETGETVETVKTVETGETV